MTDSRSGLISLFSLALTRCLQVGVIDAVRRAELAGQAVMPIPVGAGSIEALATVDVALRAVVEHRIGVIGVEGHNPSLVTTDDLTHFQTRFPPLSEA